MKMDVEKFDMTNYLSVLPMFSNLTKPERENISQDCALRRLSRGEMVFRAGEQCEEFHVIVTGQVKLYVASSSGQEKIVELIGPGQSLSLIHI